VLRFPLPETQKNLLQFIGLANYFKDYVPRMTEMVQPLRKLIQLKAYKGPEELVWTPEAISVKKLVRLGPKSAAVLGLL
jgi:hypothetical protein